MKATVGQIATATGGALLCGEEGAFVTGASIDSRNVKPGDIFVPIIGEKADAHNFISMAFENGAVASFTSRGPDIAGEHIPDKGCLISVPDTVAALQAMGGFARKRLDIPILGVTGSVGKTTTRVMTAIALSAGLSVTGTRGNRNGQLGVPLTLIAADPCADICVLEMGMSEPGEMERLVKIAAPSAAIVTNIGVSHIENLGSRENICAQKMHIADGICQDGFLILNGDEPLLREAARGRECNKVFFGIRKKADFMGTHIKAVDGGVEFVAQTPAGDVNVRLNSPGTHNVPNALAALAAAYIYGVPVQKAAGALAGFDGYAGRLAMKKVHGYMVIDDAYNASPDSMRAALDVLKETCCEGRKAAFLADMLELGPDSATFHYEAGRYAAKSGAEKFFLLGEQSRNIKKALEEHGLDAVMVEDTQQGVMAVRKWAREGDVILFKGSNGMRLKDIIDAL